MNMMDEPNKFAKVFWTTIISVLFLVAVIGSCFLAYNLYKQSQKSYEEYSDLRLYIEKNKDFLRDYAKKLLSVDSKYYSYSGDIKNWDAKLRSDLKVWGVYAFKDIPDKEEYVDFSLDYRPKDRRYASCGIVYSPNDVCIDPYGFPHEGDKFAFEDDYFRYKIERVCECLYYYEEARG